MAETINIISLKNLSKRYGKITAVDNISLDIQAGEIFAILGPHNSGKSTLFRILVSLIKPSSGTARIFDMDITKARHKILCDVGYLPAEVHNHENLRVKDLLKYSTSFYKKNCDERLEYLVKIFDLAPKSKIKDLTCAQRRKVGIIQALAHQPRLLIIDELMKDLDQASQTVFFDLLLEENRRGTTIVFSSALGLAQRIAGRLAFIKDGSLLNVVDTSEFYNNSFYKITFTSTVDVNIGHFNMPGVIDFKVKGNEGSFLYRGPVNAPLNILNTYPLIKLNIEEAQLEDVYSHYLKEDPS